MSAPTIVALTGFARSGKDTVGKILCDYHGFRRVAFGDVLKAVADDLDPLIEYGGDVDEISGPATRTRLSTLLETAGGWENLKDEVPEARQFLVDLGNSLRRHVAGIEVSSVLSGLKPGERVVNTNVYHPEEIDQIREMGGLVFRVSRLDCRPANADEAKTSLHEVDATIPNFSTVEALEVTVARLLGYYGVA